MLAGRERVVDAPYLEVERLASREVLLQAPVTADLRFLPQANGLSQRPTERSGPNVPVLTRGRPRVAHCRCGLRGVGRCQRVRAVVGADG